MRYTCNSSSPFVKVSKKCQKSVTKDFEIFPGRNGSVRLAVLKRQSSQEPTSGVLGPKQANFGGLLRTSESSFPYFKTRNLKNL